VDILSYDYLYKYVDNKHIFPKIPPQIVDEVYKNYSIKDLHMISYHKGWPIIKIQRLHYLFNIFISDTSVEKLLMTMSEASQAAPMLESLPSYGRFTKIEYKLLFPTSFKKLSK
jgi:hypothetical protein